MFLPGWDGLQNTPAEDIKQWLLSKRYRDDAQYLAMIQTKGGHRGPGDAQTQRAHSQAAQPSNMGSLTRVITAAPEETQERLRLLT